MYEYLAQAFSICLNSINFSINLDRNNYIIYFSLLKKDLSFIDTYCYDSRTYSIFEHDSSIFLNNKNVLNFISVSKNKKTVSINILNKVHSVSEHYNILFKPIQKECDEILGYVMLCSKNKFNNGFIYFIDIFERMLYNTAKRLCILDLLKLEKTETINFASLTNSEMDILKLISNGKTDEQISNDLTVSISTIRKHVSNIFLKLQCVNRTELAVKYYSTLILTMLDY